jgi:predicted nucleic acid-binding protein
VFDRLWQQVDAVDVSDDLVRVAGRTAERFGLRAGDAIHLASAAFVGDVQMLTFDRPLARASEEAGLAVIPVGA